MSNKTLPFIIVSLLALALYSFYTEPSLFSIVLVKADGTEVKLDDTPSFTVVDETCCFTDMYFVLSATNTGNPNLDFRNRLSGDNHAPVDLIGGVNTCTTTHISDETNYPFKEEVDIIPGQLGTWQNSQTNNINLQDCTQNSTTNVPITIQACIQGKPSIEPNYQCDDLNSCGGFTSAQGFECDVVTMQMREVGNAEFEVTIAKNLF